MKNLKPKTKALTLTNYGFASYVQIQAYTFYTNTFISSNLILFIHKPVIKYPLNKQYSSYLNSNFEKLKTIKNNYYF